jgi:chromosome segregation protein
LQARQKGRLGFLRGILGELIDSDVEHAPIVEAALAGADQQLVADRLADVQDNLAELDEVLGKNGQAEVLCLDRSGASTAEPPGAPDAPQIRGRVVDWVRCEDALRPAVTALLGRTLLVDTLADAADAASACPGPWRFVTTDGRVLEADGRVRFGATGRGAGVITRRSELAQLETQRQELEGAIESLTQRCADAHEQIEANQARQQNLRNDVYEANSRRVELESRLRQIGEELEKRRREKPLIARTASPPASGPSPTPDAERKTRPTR